MFFKLPLYLTLKTDLEAVKRLVNLPDASNLTPLITFCCIKFKILSLLFEILSLVKSKYKAGNFIFLTAFINTFKALFFLFLNLIAIADENISLLKCIDFSSIIFNSIFLL